MTKMAQNEYYNPEELAEVLRIKRKTLYTQISNGKFPIPYFKLGKHLLFLVSDVEIYLNSCKKEANTLPEKNKEKAKIKTTKEDLEIQTNSIKNESDIKEINQTKMISPRIRVR